MNRTDVPGDIRKPDGRLAALAILVVLLYLVLAPFLSPFAWACLLAHATWSPYRRVRQALPARPNASAALMTAVVAAALISPMLWMSYVLRQDAQQLYRLGQPWLDRSVGELVDTLSRAPWFGARLHVWLAALLSPPQTIRELILDGTRQAASQLLVLFGTLGRNTAEFALAIVFLFFAYRDGERALEHLRLRLRPGALTEFDDCLAVASLTTLAVTRTVAVAALLQGVLGAIAYAVVGFSAPVLLGLATALASLIPMVGTFLVLGPLAVWLLLGDHVWQGVGLLLWGALVIHPVDNVLRPWLVGNAARLPFLAAFVAVLGGLAAFGLLGVFVGPVIVAIALRIANR